MNCCQCEGIEKVFNQKCAADDLKTYREKGPSKTTRFLLDALKASQIAGLTLLDIGGGVGAIQHELLQAGVRQAVNVDASTAYIEAAQAEAKRQGLIERVHYHIGNFVDIASEIETADIVTLDRVICCYHDMPTLVTRSAACARQWYGLVFPRDTWWFRAAARIPNLGLWLFRDPFRIFIHSSAAVDAILAEQGFTRQFYKKTFFWQVVLYGR